MLDPFFGAGTTGLVADRLQRDCTGIELNPAYALMARNRIVNEAPLFADVRIIGLSASPIVAPPGDGPAATPPT